jgi:hypothetical protein
MVFLLFDSPFHISEQISNRSSITPRRRIGPNSPTRCRVHKRKLRGSSFALSCQNYYNVSLGSFVDDMEAVPFAWLIRARAELSIFLPSAPDLFIQTTQPSGVGRANSSVVGHYSNEIIGQDS